jgi:hypothetical protein
MPCPHVNDCQIYPYLRAGLQLWKTLYCLNEEKYALCARYQLARKGSTVPLNLLPNGKTLYIKPTQQKGE